MGKSDIPPIRFALFTGKEDLLENGWKSYRCTANQITSLVEEAKKYNHSWAQIVDLLTQVLILEAKKDEFNHWEWRSISGAHHSYNDKSTRQVRKNIDRDS